MNTKIVLFYIALFLLPYEAIPGILPSIYRPVSIYPFLLLSVLAVAKIIKEQKIKQVTVWVIIAFAYGIISSWINTACRFSSYDRVIDFTVTYIIGIIAFLAADYGFSIIKEKKENRDYIISVLSYLAKIYYIPVGIGVLELLAMIGILPMSLVVFFNSRLGGTSYSRVCMGSLEASWLSLQLILFTIIYLILYQYNKKRRYLLCAVILIVISIYNLSGQGFSTFLIALAGYYVLSMFLDKNIKTLLKNTILSLFLIILLYFGIKMILNILPPSYYTVRFQNIMNFETLIRTDGSAFIRLVYPIICFAIFCGNIPFGIGGGNFSLVFGDYIHQRYPWAVQQYAEVRQHMFLKSTGTGSLYIRLLGELGIVGFFLFIKPVVIISKKIVYIKELKCYKLMLFLLVFTLCIPIEFDSFAYVPFWTMLAFINNLNKERNGGL